MRKTVLICGLLCTSASAQVATERRVAVWTEPVSVLAGGLLQAANLSSTTNYWPVPLGVSFAAGSLDWSIGLTPVYARNRGTGDPRVLTGTHVVESFGLWGSVGPVFHTGALHLGGVFLNPKAVVGYFAATGGGYQSVEPPVLRRLETRHLFDVQIGLDFGWQRVFGPVYLAVMAGVTFGVGLNQSDPLSGPLFDAGGEVQTRAVFGFNAAVIRLGWAVPTNAEQ